MPSEAAKKRAAQKKEKKQASSRAAQKKVKSKLEEKVSGIDCQSHNGSLPVENGACASIQSSSASVSAVTSGVAKVKLSALSCTGEYQFVVDPQVADLPNYHYSI